MSKKRKGEVRLFLGSSTTASVEFRTARDFSWLTVNDGSRSVTVEFWLDPKGGATKESSMIAANILCAVNAAVAWCNSARKRGAS